MSTLVKGEKIQLSRSIASDIDSIMKFEISNSPFVHQYSKEKHLKLLNDNDCLHLSIQKNEDLKLIGHMILFGLNSEYNTLQLKRFTIEEKGKGYGREALRLIKKACFENLKYHRFWLDVYDNNSRAINLYESEGFIMEGLLRDSIKTKTGYSSQRIYSILDKEYFK